MAAEVSYHSGPIIENKLSPWAGRAVVMVRVGQSEKLRAVVLTDAQVLHLALQCLLVLKKRSGE